MAVRAAPVPIGKPVVQPQSSKPKPFVNPGGKMRLAAPPATGPIFGTKPGWQGVANARGLTVAPPPSKPSYSATTVTNPPATTPPPTPSPLDATYYQAVDTNAQAVADRLAKLQTGVDTATTNLGLADYTGANPLGLPVARQFAQQQLAARYAAAKRGGLLSTGLENQLGGIQQGFEGKYSDAVRALAAAQTAQTTGQQAESDAQRQFNTDQWLAAVGRASQAAASNPALGLPATPPVNDQYLAKGAKAPGYILTPPKGAPSSAKWSSSRPAGKWRGIGGGWWVPVK
jgi:hypothetical protein